MGVYIAGEDVAAKPSRAGFEDVTRGLIAHAGARGHALAADEIAMVGDNYMTDGGAIQAGLAFVKVRPVKTDERPFRRPVATFVKRSFQRATRAYASAAALAWDHLSRRPRPLQLDR
jgi:FMN phosphatase YigB (HAD superfamily)